MDKDRIYYFGLQDISAGYYLEKSARYIETFDENTIIADVNQAMEIYAVIQYIDSGARLLSWTNEYYNTLSSKSMTMKKCYYKFMNSLENGNIVELCNNLEYNYQKSFLNEVVNLKKEFSEDVFYFLLDNRIIILHNIVTIKKLVEKYGEVIREQIIKNTEEGVILILDWYKDEKGHDKIYLPNQLTPTEREYILLNYIHSESPNLNYLQVIVNMQSCKDLPITDKTRLEAKRKIKQLEEEFFSDSNNSTEISYSVMLSKDIDYKKIEYKNFSLSITYSYNWLSENLDYPTILNNFIYMFEFADTHMRSLHVSRKSDRGLLEILQKIDNDRFYNNNFMFMQNNSFATMQILMYYDLLKQNSIRLEDVIEWFFSSYLPEEFGISSISISMPSEGSKFYEKCNTICSCMDSVIRQYYLFVTEGEIDQELLELSSNHIKYQHIPSIIPDKYIYKYGDKFDTVSYYLFSDQCSLSYSGPDESYNTFFDLLANRKIRKEDYSHSDQVKIDFLFSEGIVDYSSEGFIEYRDKKLVLVLKDLYTNEVISWKRYPSSFQYIFDLLKEKGYIKYESSLLSKGESALFNYFLNKSEFINSLDLRNKYSHGSKVNNDEEENKNNYMIFMRLMILLIIKINDELDLKFPLS